MTLSPRFFITPLAFAVWLCLALLPMDAFAEDIRVEAQLVWATNDKESPNRQHVPVEEGLANKLRNIFKWKNYFQVKKQVVDIPSRQTKQIKMSKKCMLEIEEMEGPNVQVRLFGEGILVNKTTEPLTAGKIITIAGDDVNMTAWFVVIQRVSK